MTIPQHQRRRLRSLAWLLLGTVALIAPATSAASQPVRRFALVVGANSGGTGRVTLRYANTDASRISAVLRVYGGVARGDLVVLHEATPSRIRDGLERLRARISGARAHHRRVELIFYYSGHSDERGLLPSGQRVPWDELRDKLKALGADVRIAILDSCASGALIRTKGGKRRAPFLFDASSQVKGHAYLTSSSADEAAQESDRIGASYFTHHLVSGLRGAADMDQDRRVTLSEAYQYAFRRTLARTERTAKGPQHANYDFELAGSGDVVLTGLTVAASVLVFGKPTVGRFFIRDHKGQLVAELEKGPGRVVELGLEPGAYRLNLHQRDRVYSYAVTLARGRRLTVDPGAFRQVSRVAARTRGKGVQPAEVMPAPASIPPPAEPTGTKRPGTQVDVSIFPGLSLRGAAWLSDVQRLSLNVVAGLHHNVSGVEIGSVANLVTGDLQGLQISAALNLVRGQVHGTQIAGAANIAVAGVDGAQISAGANLAGSVKGAQIAAGTNLAMGRVEGTQAAAGLNLTGELRGLQMAAGLNLAKRVYGVQIAAGVNVTATLYGLQVGVFNFAGTASGVQIGVVNFALGDSADADAFGLFSFVRNGYNHLEVWSSDSHVANVGLKFGGKHMYTVLMMGVSTLTAEPTEFGLGWGGHWQLPGRFYLDIDGIAGSHLTRNNPERITDLVVRTRVTLGLRLMGRLAVFAGVKANWTVAFDHREPPVVPFGTVRVTPETEQTFIGVGPGFFVGLQI